MSDVQRSFGKDPLRDPVEILQRLRLAEDLVARAAELLRPETDIKVLDLPDRGYDEWNRKRFQWLRDAGAAK